MKKSTLLLVFSVLFASIISAKSIDEHTAQKVAKNYYQYIANQQVNSLYLAYSEKASDDSNIYYVYNINANTGFIIISGDDAALPVWGYSSTGYYNNFNLKPGLAKWIEGYKQQILTIKHDNTQANEAIKEAWKSCLSNRFENASGVVGVGPLLKTTWDQSPYYNEFCPGGSVTGCVATAMAQVMKYWNFPPHGTGFHSYNEDNYGTLSVNYGNATYDWSSMPNNVTSPNSAVATLMYHCGVSINMNYSPDVSGAQTLDVVNALKTFFSYPEAIQGLHRSNYSDSQWKEILKFELDAARPIQYAGNGTGGGHSFVCDGYDNNDFFHFNWGWGGQEDGFFLIDALNPGSLGTGGGTGGFNGNQRAIIGIQPPTVTQSIDMQLFDYVTPSPAFINYNQAFNISSNILNNGATGFAGDYCAAVFDIQGNFVDFVEIKNNWTLAPGSVYTNPIQFSTSGLTSMLPGKYNVGIYYRPTDGQWAKVSDSGTFINWVEITVTSPNEIELYSALSITPGTTFNQGDEVTVNVNVINEGNNTFYGTYSADLYNLDGTWVEGIGSLTESNGLPAGYTYSAPYLTFNTSAINASPGTYLLAIQHIPDGGNWSLTGSTNFDNPIYVIVVAPSIQPDAYENNNSTSEAYPLALTFAANSSTEETTGSNLHIVTDNDFYKLDLDQGYDYEITARIHDSYNSENGEIYSCDVLFSYDTGNGSSNTFDDVIPYNIYMNNGGTIVFHVAPYYAGEKGTYILDLSLTRTVSTSIEDNVLVNSFSVYPIPASHVVYLKPTIANIEINNITIQNILGQPVEVRLSPIITNDLITLDVSDIPNGIYTIQIEDVDQNVFVKLITINR